MKIKSVVASSLLLIAGQLQSGQALSAEGETTALINKSANADVIRIGNSDAGASLNISGTAKIWQDDDESAQKRTASIGLDVSIYGQRLRALDASAYSHFSRGEDYHKTSLKQQYKIMGVSLISAAEESDFEGEYALEMPGHLFILDGFCVQQPIPQTLGLLSVQGCSVGSISTRVVARQETDRVGERIKDFGKAYTYASVDVGLNSSLIIGVPELVEGGVTGYVDLVDAWTESHNKTASTIDYDQPVESRINYSGELLGRDELDVAAGKVDLWFKLLGGDVARETIAQWSPVYHTNQTLFSDNFNENFSWQ